MLDPGYFYTKPGIFRIVGLLLGLIGVIMLGDTIVHGAYYNGKNGLEDQCDREKKYYDRKALCPLGFFMIGASAIADLCWIAAVIVLIVVIYQNGPSWDFVVQIVLAVCFFVAVVLIILFLFMVWIGDYPCTSSSSSSRSNGCSELSNSVYLLNYIYFGTLLIILAGVFFILSAIFGKKGGRVGGGRVGGGGGGGQSQPQPQASQANYREQQEEPAGSRSHHHGHRNEPE